MLAVERSKLLGEMLLFEMAPLRCRFGFRKVANLRECEVITQLDVECTTHFV